MIFMSFQDPRSIDSLCALLQHGINNVYLLLQEFELLKDGDSSLVEFGLKSNRESVVDDYLHVSIHIKYRLKIINFSEELLCCLSSILEKCNLV